MPLLCMVSHQAQQLDTWRLFVGREEADARVVRRLDAREALRTSTESERARLAASQGFDASKESGLGPAHLERRLPWNEYRAAERLVGLYQRRAKRAGVQGCDSSGLEGVSAIEPDLSTDAARFWAEVGSAAPAPLPASALALYMVPEVVTAPAPTSALAE